MNENPGSKIAINFSCPHCGQSLEADRDMVGTAIDCPTCCKSIAIPTIAANPMSNIRPATTETPLPLVNEATRDVPEGPSPKPKRIELPTGTFDGSSKPNGWRRVWITIARITAAVARFFGKLICRVGWLIVVLFRKAIVAPTLRVRLVHQYRKAGAFAYQNKIAESECGEIRSQIQAIEAEMVSSKSWRDAAPTVGRFRTMTAGFYIFLRNVRLRIKVGQLQQSLGREQLERGNVNPALGRFAGRATKTRECVERMRTINPNNGGIGNLVAGLATLGVIICVIYPLLMGKPSDAEAQYRLGLKYAKGEGVKRNEKEAMKWFQMAADQGNAKGQRSIGLIYAIGHVVEKDEAKAVEWFRKAAEQGDAKAQYNLGVAYYEGCAVAKDEEESGKWFRKATESARNTAEEGDVASQILLGTIYENGRGVGKDEAEAVKWFRKAAEKGNATGQTLLGSMYADGRGVAKDEEKAVEWFRKAAEQGDAIAQNNLGVHFGTGKGVDKNEMKAVQWYRKAADLGYSVAQNNLGVVYSEGRGVAKDEEAAVEWFRKAAEQGYSDAQRNLGVMYSEGRGVAEDGVKAAEWFLKAEEQGSVEAQNDLGVKYANGQGVEKDEAKAVEWFRKAAEQGHASAQVNLGISYFNGRGVAQDDAKAAAWFRKAAEQGHAYAQNKLGLMYREGRGVAKDEERAAEWFRKATEQGYAEVQRNLGVSPSKGDGVTNPHPGELLDAKVNPKISGADDEEKNSVSIERTQHYWQKVNEILLPFVAKTMNNPNYTPSLEEGETLANQLKRLDGDGVDSGLVENTRDTANFFGNMRDCSVKNQMGTMTQDEALQMMHGLVAFIVLLGSPERLSEKYGVQFIDYSKNYTHIVPSLGQEQRERQTPSGLGPGVDSFRKRFGVTEQTPSGLGPGVDSFRRRFGVTE